MPRLLAAGCVAAVSPSEIPIKLEKLDEKLGLNLFPKKTELRF